MKGVVLPIYHKRITRVVRGKVSTARVLWRGIAKNFGSNGNENVYWKPERNGFEHLHWTSHQTLEINVLHGTSRGVKTRDFENTCTINCTTVHQHDSFHDRMTIDILFIAKNSAITCTSCQYVFLKFRRKDPWWDTDRRAREMDFRVRCQRYWKNIYGSKFIEKVWYACVRHGCIAEDYDIMGKLLDTMRIIL